MKCACFMFERIYFCQCTKVSAWRNGMAPVMMFPVLSGRENWDSICIGMAWYWRSHSYSVQNTEYRVTPRKGYPGFLETSNTRLNSIFDHDSGWEGNELAMLLLISIRVRKYSPYRVCTSYTHVSKFRLPLPFSPTCLDNSTSLVFEMSISACSEGLT